MKPVILSDLDDCLFQTREKCAVPQDLKVMSKLVDGAPSGYATRRQQVVLSWLSIGQLIPVTARSVRVLARVDISQAPAICANGGCIVQADGNVDRIWHDRLVAQARNDHVVEDVYEALTSSLRPEDFRHWIVAENGLPLYIVIKSNRRLPTELLELAERQQAALPGSWRRHSNGSNLAYLPGWLSKRHAVQYLLETIRADAPNTPVVGIGDSLSDAGFMDLCDFAMMPTSSQFWKSATANNDWLR